MCVGLGYWHCESYYSLFDHFCFLEGSLGVIYELISARFYVGRKLDIRGIKLGPTSGQKMYSYFTCFLHLQKKNCENKILKLETPISWIDSGNHTFRTVLGSYGNEYGIKCSSALVIIRKWFGKSSNNVCGSLVSYCATR
jgi:hypothetical protein